jgi:uncharacterized membrane protein
MTGISLHMLRPMTSQSHGSFLNAKNWFFFIFFITDLKPIPFAFFQKAAASKAGSRKRQLERRNFFSWFCDNGDPSADDIAEIIKDDMW